jgi:phage portal protein BeeE
MLLQSLFSPGIMSMVSDDGFSQLPLQAEDRKQITDDFMQRNSGKPVITDKKVTWSPMSFPVKDLMLFEEMTADKVAIIDSFGLNQYMFGSGEGAKGSTFSNVEMGERQAYNSTIIPETELLYDDINQQLALEKDGLYIKPDFSHISVLQADSNKEADSMLKRANAVEKISAQIQLSDDEKRTLLGI